jgi:hypothetical protein
MPSKLFNNTQSKMGADSDSLYASLWRMFRLVLEIHKRAPQTGALCIFLLVAYFIISILRVKSP